MHLAIDISDYLTEINCAIQTLELSIKDGVTNTPSVRNVLKKTKGIAVWEHVNSSKYRT